MKNLKMFTAKFIVPVLTVLFVCPVMPVHAETAPVSPEASGTSPTMTPGELEDVIENRGMEPAQQVIENRGFVMGVDKVLGAPEVAPPPREIVPSIIGGGNLTTTTWRKEDGTIVKTEVYNKEKNSTTVTEKEGNFTTTTEKTPGGTTVTVQSSNPGATLISEYDVNGVLVRTTYTVLAIAPEPREIKPTIVQEGNSTTTTWTKADGTTVKTEVSNYDPETKIKIVTVTEGSFTTINEYDANGNLNGSTHIIKYE